MYDISGAFGQVRRVTAPPLTQAERNGSVLFHLNDAGWHSCNSLYRITRANGKQGHLLLFSLSDGGVLQLADRPPIQLPPSSVAWVPADCGHCYYTEAGKQWGFYWLDVSEKDALPFSQLFGDRVLLPLTDIKAIAEEMERLLQNRLVGRAAFLPESSRLIGNIYHLILAEVFSASERERTDEMILTITAQMDAFCEREWNASELAKQYFISVPQLMRRFKAATGTTPHAYVITVRLRVAKLYLQHTDLSVAEISRKVGFSCAGNFIKQFRGRYGLTPKNYRNSIRTS